MKRKTLTICLVAAMIIAVFCSCGKQKPRFVIGVSQCSNDVWREKMNSELRIAAFYYNDIDLQIKSANDNTDMQMAQIKDFINKKVDLLIVSPNEPIVSLVIEDAYRRGIPVVVFDRRTDPNCYTAYIGADNTQMGRNMARHLSTIEKGKARVLEVGGLGTSSPAVERGRGFHEEIKKHSNISVVKKIDGDWTEDNAYNKVDSLLKADCPEFNYVYAHNDRMAKGARRAIMKHGMKGISFLGIDAIPQKGGGLEMVRDGKLTASYIYPTRGDEVMKLAMDILEKRPYRKENLLMSAIVTSDNANVLLMQNNEVERLSDKIISLRNRIETTNNAFDTQRNYLLALLILVGMLIAVCAIAVKAYMEKKRFNLQLKASIERQKKMTDDMEKMTQTQLRFFTNISHELRTPLTLISGPADQLAESEEIRGENWKLVNMIRRNTAILRQMVGEILEFRKVQNNKASLTLNRFDIAHDMATWANDFVAVAVRKRIKMAFETDSKEIIMIGDKEKVAHIYFNLMTNALKYTPEGGKITTSLAHRNGTVALTVADTGRGISMEEQKHIFDRFYQAADSVGGTGIGLALVKAYTDMHHGTARVESLIGEGAKFIIELPDSQPGYDANADKQTDISKEEANLVDDYTVSDLKTIHNIDTITATDDYDSNRPLVLIVDDNAGMRDFLKGILSKKFNIIEAQNGKEGIEMAQKNVPQLVVSDVMMPVMDGLEMCRRMKEATSTCHIPVILLTARSLEEQRTEGYDKGADSYITKPFSADTLTARIDNLLKSRHMLKQIFSLSSDKQQEEEVQALGERDKSFIMLLRKTIKKHIPDAEYSVENMGAEMGLSRVQLYRKVKALTGFSVIDLLRKARLAKAKLLIETTDKNISEVAYEVGFTTPSYFSRRFKEEYGVTPGEYATNRSMDVTNDTTND